MWTTKSIPALAKPTPTAEAGAGLVAAIFGTLVFVLLLLFAVQELVGLYCRSLVTATAYDAALAVAGGGASGDSGGERAKIAAAEATARSRLGGLGSHVSFTWREVSTDRVVLEVRLPTPQFVPLRVAPQGIIDRTVIIRTETFR